MTILKMTEEKGSYQRTMNSLENQLVGVDEIRIAGRDYKRQSEFFDNQWSTTSNSVEFALNSSGFHIDDMNIVRWNSNNQEPFGDMLLDLHEAGHITLDQVDKTCMSKEIKTEEFWKEQFSSELTYAEGQ
tara:strand:- start:2136 stop:2525 length:390 start_codon:yes stop_codon:yes gene_type:complete